MIKSIKQCIVLIVAAACSACVVIIAAPFIFWLGRSNSSAPSTPVDPELLGDDPGVDLDEVA